MSRSKRRLKNATAKAGRYRSKRNITFTDNTVFVRRLTPEELYWYFSGEVYMLCSTDGAGHRVVIQDSQSLFEAIRSEGASPMWLQ